MAAKTTPPQQGLSRLAPPRGSQAVRFVHRDSEFLVLSYPAPRPKLPPKLTAAERAVALLLAQGLSSAQVAAARNVALPTICNQIRAVYGKLGVSSRIELVNALYRSHE